MRIIVSLLIAAVSLSAQTFNSQNAGNLPSQVEWGFIGNLTIPLNDPTPVYTPIFGNNANNGTATCATAQLCASPFHAPLGEWCLELDGPQPARLTLTLYHTVGGVWVVSPLTITVGTGGLQAAGVYCSAPGGVTVDLSGYSGPFESLAPSSSTDQIAIQIVSQSSNTNVLTSVSYVSPPPSFPAAVNSQTLNILPQSANGRGFWAMDGHSLGIAGGTSSPYVCDLTGVACSPLANVDRFVQEPAMKSGRISGLCVYVKGTLSTDIVVGMNVDGVMSPVAVSVLNGTSGSSVCDSAHYVDTIPSTLLGMEIINTNAGSLTGASMYVTFLF